MSIPVTCPECQKTTNAPDSAAGKQGRCPGCGAVVPIPDLVALEEAPAVKPEIKARGKREHSKTTPEQQKNAAVGCIGLVIVIGIVGYWLAPGGSKPADAPLTTPAGGTVPTDFDSSRVKLSAESLVYDHIKSPSSAKFPATEILASKHPRYIVLVACDSQNSFGAMIRSYFLCCILQKDATNYAFSNSTGFLENRTREDAIRNLEAFKAMNDWDEKPPTTSPTVTPTTKR